MILPAERQARPFEFELDTFAFANELVWQYRFDPQTGAMSAFRTTPPPAYSHRCFVLVRSARQFLYHARFAPEQPALDPVACAPLIRQVVSRSPRQPSLPDERVVIPGYASLREFSQAQTDLLKAHCGGAWQSYCLRSHWRMVFPISRSHQARTAESLTRAITAGQAPIVHLVRFPQLTINHGIILFAKRDLTDGWGFAAYDPNLPGRPTELSYHTASRTFQFPRNHYWFGGRLEVIEIYRNWLY